MPGMNFVEMIAMFSSSYQLKLFVAMTLRSSSGGMSVSGVVLNFGRGGSISLGMLVPALKAGPVGVDSNVRGEDVCFLEGKGEASVRDLKRSV